MKSLLDGYVKIKHVLIIVALIFIITFSIFLINHRLDASAVILAFSTLIAPLAALQIQVYVEGLKAKNAKKMDIFRTLMATRATPLDREHVKALNMINIEFYHDKEVINAWKSFLDVRSRTDLVNPPKEYEDSLVALLQKIAEILGLHFYDDEIRKGCYRPNAHVAIENMQLEVLDNLKKALDQGKLHVLMDAPGSTSDQTKK